MIKAKQKLVLNILSVFCCLIVVLLFLDAMPEAQSKAQVLGLIAGSFGAGATLVNAIRDYRTDRKGNWGK